MAPREPPRQREAGNLRELVQGCLRAALDPATRLPSDNEDWIESGALDSMRLVDVFLAIEKAAAVPGFFDRQEGRPPRSTSGVAQALWSAMTERSVAPQTKVSKRARPTQVAEAGIVGWGAALGSNRVDAHLIEREFALPLGTISERAGIQSVNRVAASETEVTLAVEAASAALTEAGAELSEIDWIVATSETFLGVPSLGASVHGFLLARDDCGVLDVGGACLGLLNAVCAACAILRVGEGRHVLVVSADVHSRLLSPGRIDGRFAGLFGDGASAFVLRRLKDNEKAPPYRIGHFCFGCAGASAGALRLTASGEGQLVLNFDGEALGRAAVRRMKKVIEELEAASHLSREQASGFAFHQPNPRLVRRLVKDAGLPMDKIPFIADLSGNLGSSTCGVALSRVLSQHARRPPAQRGPIFLAAVGPGMLWGGAVLY